MVDFFGILILAIIVGFLALPILAVIGAALMALVGIVLNIARLFSRSS